MKPIYSIIFAAVSLLLFIPLITAQEAAPDINLALTGFDNMEENSKHDYISSIISAVIREDLSNTEGISLLDRESMTELLQEQKLQISGLFDDRTAVRAGKLLGSDYLTGGSYIVFDTEVLLDVTLINVETGRVISFSSRGNSEDIIHIAAEKIARELTGRKYMFRTADSGRPIIKAALMPPGTLKLFSPLIDARIYIDGDFYGYTRGDGTVPIEIELQPGLHSVKTDLSRDFGVIIEPEVLFRYWEKEFEIVSGKTVVLEDPTRHFNDRLYRIQKVLQDNISLDIPGTDPWSGEFPYSFTDRDGKTVSGILTIYLQPTEVGGLNAQVMLQYDYQRHVWDFECPPEEEFEFKETIGLITFGFELETRYINRVSADWDIWRNDVYQGLHREETGRGE